MLSPVVFELLVKARLADLRREARAIEEKARDPK